MKLKIMIGSTIALAFMSSIVYAVSGGYYPPERINCTLTDSSQVNCSGFSRQYLIEDTSNANLKKGKDETFYFVSAAAYFTPNHDEASIFYTYNNAYFKMVKLKTINTSIRPDFENGDWKKLNDEIYTCDASYMRCPITNLPDLS